MDEYKGWRIQRELSAPVTGRWRAYRQGVRIGTTTEEGLKRMIDTRNHEEREARRALNRA